MSFSHIDVVHPPAASAPAAAAAADAPSSHHKLLCTLWCLLVSQTSLCCLLGRLSSLSVCWWLLIIQRQTDLRSSAAAAKEKQERWRSSIRATGRTHEIQEDKFREEKTLPVSFISLYFQHLFGMDLKVCENVAAGRSWDIMWRAPREWPGKSWPPFSKLLAVQVQPTGVGEEAGRGALVGWSPPYTQKPKVGLLVLL